MTVKALYKVQEYSPEFRNIFRGAYEDFKTKAFSEYKFELEPLEYDDFIASLDEGLIKCILLLESSIPTAFLVYTTEISEALELNLIHCLGAENLNEKRKLLLNKFLEVNKDLLSQKVVTYPMLGNQEDFTPEITNYGFKLIGLSVIRFKFDNAKTRAIFSTFDSKEMSEEYRIVNWEESFKDKVVEIVNKAFLHTSDALFDPRFLTNEGSKDIVNKITQGIYGNFLPDCTSILLHNEEPVGICFANITAGRIANIPLVGILEDHKGKGLGENLLKETISKMLSFYEHTLSEINASTETDNYPALQMYRRLGFKEDYYYPQAYRPIK